MAKYRQELRQKKHVLNNGSTLKVTTAIDVDVRLGIQAGPRRVVAATLDGKRVLPPVALRKAAESNLKIT